MRELNGDRGVIAVLSALIMSTVILGSAALAIDVAALYTERRQLQNGADAAAVAIAQSCARNLAIAPANPCDSTLAAGLANGNAVDTRATVTQVCGTAPGLGSCPQGGPRPSCAPVKAGAPPYVEVRTRTRTADGTNKVDPVFARTIPGNEGYTGTAVRACARAGYGSPTTVTSVLPVAIAKCLVKAYTDLHGGFATESEITKSTAALLAAEIEIELKKTSSETCPTTTTSGNFGYLTPDGECTVTTTVNAALTGSTGNSNPKTLGCSDSYLKALLGKVIYLPISPSVEENGSKASFNISGYAAFYFTGWQLAGTSHKSIASGLTPCQKPTTCISGVFLRGLQPVPGPISAAPDYGATVVALLG